MKFGLVGAQIAYSLSPFIHQFLLDAHQIQGTYQTLDMQPDRLEMEESIRELKTYNGLNITIPYKETMLELFPQAVLSEEVKAIQAVNCIHIQQHEMTFHNTDYYGFLQPLSDYQIQGTTAIILGNGGGMKAVKYALEQAYPTLKIIVAARNQHNGYETLYTDLNRIDTNTIGLVVNTTPVSPYQWNNLSDNTIVYDLNYRLEKCQILFDHPNTIHITGLRMLVYQAIRSFEIWNQCHVTQSTIERLFKGIEVQYGIK